MTDIVGDKPLSVRIVGTGISAAAHRAAWESSGERLGIPAKVVVAPPAERVAPPAPDLLVRCGIAGQLDTVHLWDGRSVADLAHRCVPAVRLAADLSRARVIGELREISVVAPLTATTVDLVTVLAGDDIALLRRSGPRRVDGLLDGGGIVVIEDAAAGAVRAEVDGSRGSLAVDLRIPLAVTVSTCAGGTRRVAAPLRQHPYPAILGPATHPSRLWRAAEHLAADALDLVRAGATDAASAADLTRACRVMAEAAVDADAGPPVPDRDRLSVGKAVARA
jgi:hypothetical protein